MTEAAICYDFDIATEPTQEPVSVGMVQHYVQNVPTKSQVTSTEARDYMLIQSLIPGARRRIESWHGVSLITQTRVAWYDADQLDGDSIRLPNGPVQSVSSIKYYDLDNDENTWDSASYLVADGNRAEVIVNSGYVWPTELRAKRALKVTYVAGYGAGSIGTPAFVGSGLDDISTGGQYLGSKDRTYRATILTEGSPDKFTVSDNAGVSLIHASGASGASVSTSYAEVDSGLYLKWGAATGHTASEYWTIACTGHDVPESYQAAVAMMTGYILAGFQGHLNDNLNETIQSGGVPPAVMGLLGMRYV